ncbi:MAG: phage tail protein [Gemmatimonadota bacterium]|nr:phage tail protein [Gemmatimonadota bacterium]
MPVLRETPYGSFNFLVSFEGLDPESVQAGFSAVSGLDRSVEMLQYRAGNYKTNAPRLIPGRASPITATLSRGLIGDTILHEWLDASLRGSADRRTVLIQLLAEDRSGVVQTWRLVNALPTAMEGPELDATGHEVAVERLVLIAESMVVE